MTDTAEHVRIVKTALHPNRAWAAEHVDALADAHTRALEDLNSEKELRIAAQAREGLAKVSEDKAHQERFDAKVLAASLQGQLDFVRGEFDRVDGEHRQTKGVLNDHKELLSKAEEQVTLYKATGVVLNAHLEDQSDLSTRLSKRLQTLAGVLTGVPRRFGHVPDCDCAPCSVIRETLGD